MFSPTDTEKRTGSWHVMKKQFSWVIHEDSSTPLETEVQQLSSDEVEGNLKL